MITIIAHHAPHECRCTQPSVTTPSPQACRAPTLQSAVNVLPRAASSSSAEGATAVSLDYYEEDEEDGSFHQFHACWVKLASPRREAPLHWVVHNSPSTTDPLWQTTWWLKSFEEQCKEDEPISWPLIHPLTDGGDVAMLALARQLMAAWRWATTISASPICLPAPTVMNIEQFLEEDTTGRGWSMRQWLKAYTCGLQRIGKAVEGRHWRPEGEGFAP